MVTMRRATRPKVARLSERERRATGQAGESAQPGGEGGRQLEKEWTH